MDNQEELIIGVCVIVKGNALVGTVINIDGNFSLEAPVESTLVLSYIGYTPMEIKLGDTTSLYIVLQENTELFEGLNLYRNAGADTKEASRF
ncbi:carboxypeptidase-like regulatory domain-containing protein [Dysgonomonas sp. 511]|uniref:carboxypeptidase-like regulatory domain-containing protein n=1 Tax=Dysgonomonas sp. 511 TaxID=2302930 RepID=UPI0034CD5A2F